MTSLVTYERGSIEKSADPLAAMDSWNYRFAYTSPWFIITLVAVCIYYEYSQEWLGVSRLGYAFVIFGMALCGRVLSFRRLIQRRSEVTRKL